MQKEYDFSKAEQGRFYCEADKLEVPIYLDAANRNYFTNKAKKMNNDIDKMVNSILRKEIALLKLVGS